MLLMELGFVNVYSEPGLIFCKVKDILTLMALEQHDFSNFELPIMIVLKLETNNIEFVLRFSD